MAAPIPPLLKYSIVFNLLNFLPILIKLVSKFIVYKVLYSKAQYLLSLRSPLTQNERATSTLVTHICLAPCQRGIANSVNQIRRHRTRRLIRVCTVCLSSNIFTHVYKCKMDLLRRNIRSRVMDVNIKSKNSIPIL